MKGTRTTPTVLWVDKVFGEMLLFEQGDVLRVSYERDADDPHGSLGG